MFSATAVPARVLTRASHRLRYPTQRRQYATDYEQRTKQTLKTSSRLTWLTTTAALGAAALYYSTSTSTSPAKPNTPSPSSPSSTSTPTPGHRRKAAYATDVPKPVEDRHGDTVTKHSIAARKNQTKTRVGKFSGEEFDNHELEHTPGEPGGDFEKKEKTESGRE